jgi:hypothetical protein
MFVEANLPFKMASTRVPFTFLGVGKFRGKLEEVVLGFDFLEFRLVGVDLVGFDLAVSVNGKDDLRFPPFSIFLRFERERLDVDGGWNLLLLLLVVAVIFFSRPSFSLYTVLFVFFCELFGCLKGPF